MVSRLIFEPIVCLVDAGYFIRLTPIGNSQFNLGKSRDEFKLELKQDTTHEELDE